MFVSAKLPASARDEQFFDNERIYLSEINLNIQQLGFLTDLVLKPYPIFLHSRHAARSPPSCHNTAWSKALKGDFNFIWNREEFFRGYFAGAPRLQLVIGSGSGPYSSS